MASDKAERHQVGGIQEVFMKEVEVDLDFKL